MGVLSNSHVVAPTVKVISGSYFHFGSNLNFLKNVSARGGASASDAARVFRNF